MQIALLVKPLELREGDVILSAGDAKPATVRAFDYAVPNPKDGTDMIVHFKDKISDRVREDSIYVLINRS